MTEVKLPSIKTHPVLMSIVTITFLLAFGVACAFGGWTLRVMAESRAELAVVLDDSEFMQWLEAKIITWSDDFEKNQETFYEQNRVIPDCLAKPMPQFYRDNDFGLQPDREQEE